jgi:hypothetical protein
MLKDTLDAIYISSGRIMAVSCPLHIAEARVQTQTRPRKICGGQSDTGTGFPPRVIASPVSIIPPIFHTLLCLNTTFTRRTDRKNKWGETYEPLSKAMLFRRKGSI